MITLVHGDLLNAKEDLICHQVNCRRKMNKGLAKQIRDKYPNVWENYKELCAHYPDIPEKLLGTIQYISTEDKTIVNIFGQDNYGSNGGVYTNIWALEIAFNKIAKRLRKTKETIAMPYKIGCGLGGGNWDSIYRLIEKYLGKYNVVLYVQGEDARKIIKW